MSEEEQYTHAEYLAYKKVLRIRGEKVVSLEDEELEGDDRNDRKGLTDADKKMISDFVKSSR